ncbi:MAG: NAD+ synthase [Dehalococcoidia bacterium]
MKTLRVGLAQINTTIGDLDGNVAKVLEYAAQAGDLGCDVVAFPELAVTGYPPEDLLLRRSFIVDNLAALRTLVDRSKGLPVLVVGFVDSDDGGIYNAAAVVHDGKLAGVYHKWLLPNYGVFDEKRYFRAGSEAPVFEIAPAQPAGGGVRIGVNVCEDIWSSAGPTRAQAQAGAEVIVNINGSPYHAGKAHEREAIVSARVRENGVALCYVNMVGGQDELVFDGGSMIVDASGAVIARAPQFDEELLVCDVPALDKTPQPVASCPLISISSAPSGAKPPVASRIAQPLSPDAEVYAALVTATRDYVRKIGYERVVVGLSGGIDSTMVAGIAVDALGADRVKAVSMPSRYSSEGSIADARIAADNMGIELLIVPIEPAHAAYLEMLRGPFGGAEPGTAEENLQARIRGNVLMALSNKFGWLVLTTGNKSEYATGYCTLYGDMAGGYAVLKDVPKTLVYRLAEHRNRAAGRDLVPRSVIEKPPSAELRPDQLDIDSLPPYSVLDPILEAYVEDEKSLEEIVALGHDEALARRVMGMVDRNEYKRRQAPPGVKITPRAFGRDRRLPLANKYRGY